MSSYLMMLYVTLEQESALKNFFLGQGWTFCKPDLSVTTDKLGPSTLKQTGHNQLEPYLETPVAPIYNKKRKPKSSKSKETPPLKQQKSAQKQQSNDELEEVGNVMEGEEVGSEAKEARLGQSSDAENQPCSSTSVVLEDGREVTVKIEAAFSESDNNEEGEGELKGDNDDDIDDHPDDDNDETDVDYNFLEEGEIRLKNEDISLSAGTPSGVSPMLDQLHGDNTIEDSVNNETKVEDGAKIQEFVCQVCGKVFSTGTALKRHKSRHMEKKQVCDVCSKAFVRRDELNDHMKLHSNVRQYMCSVCGKAFKKFSCMQVHYKNVHCAQSFPCDICKKTFNSKQTMREHKKVHGEKSVCTVCNKRVFYLQRHKLKCGKSDRNYQCELCEKTFVFKSYLKEHMRTKHGPESYRCSQCSEVFRYRATFNKHLQQCKPVSLKS